ncbi:MAG: carbohydrate kinase family protein [Nitrososphaerota archaeon]|nr:carbohydrate kinase family protein [Nitrososphaerota archaeon]
MCAEESITRIRTALSKLGQKGKVSVMPDYFVDRLVRINSLDILVDSIKAKSAEGAGGSIRGVPQFEVKGGNAVNLGYTLAKFGANVHVIAIANSLPAEALRSTFRGMSNSKLHIIEGKAGFTTSLEFEDAGRHVNVMISDAGDVQEFDGTRLLDEHWKAIGESQIVCVVNWAANKKGNALCERVFSFARQRGASTFFDPADVSGQLENILEFKKRILDERLVDTISLNENETRVLCKLLCDYNLPQHYSVEELKRAAFMLSEIAGSRIDLHTNKLSISCLQDDIDSVDCHKVVQKTVTGAGDVWDAADVCGYLMGLSVEDRLFFSNSAAGLYVSRETAESPTLDEVLAFLTK